jgi:hypothetical protein
LAIGLTHFIGLEEGKTLYIPYIYADTSEIESLQEEFDGMATEVNRHVYIRASGTKVMPEALRRALVSTIHNCSVGWFLDGELADGVPLAAFVSTFDGEGWAILGKSVLVDTKLNANVS